MEKGTLVGGIEAGGTKFICLVADDSDHISSQVRIPTKSPTETLDEVIHFFEPFVASDQIHAIGIGSFGPLDLDPASPTYGYISATPKPGWSNTDIRGIIERALHVMVAIDTDVNAAALGEFTWGASRGVDPSLYLTVGTGIGGGCVINGRPHLGLINPEMGHLRIQHDLNLDSYPGNCPFHGDCFEGLASGHAIRGRFGVGAETLPDEHPFWELESSYIATALVNLILTLSPKKIILGGGVMRRAFLFARIRRKVQDLLHGYVSHSYILSDIENYIVPPALGHLSGSLGAVALAQMLK
jgi:fructokinase